MQSSENLASRNLPENGMNKEIILYMVKLLKMPSSAQKRALILNVFVFLKSDSRVSFFSLE